MKNNSKQAKQQTTKNKENKTYTKTKHTKQ